MTAFNPIDAWAFKILMTGAPLNGQLAAVSEPWRSLASLIETMNGGERLVAWQGALALRPDHDAIRQAVLAADPAAPMPSAPTGKVFATCADINRVQSAVTWSWPGWLPSSRIVGIAAGEGVGKTRFTLDLARRAWHGEPWPDGQPMTLPSSSPTIWVAADGQQDELATTLTDLGMPLEAIVFPTAPDDPYGGSSLDEPSTWDALDEAIPIYKPAFVVVDSLTYATRSDLGEQRTIATLKDPLVRLAQTHQTIVILLLHVSKEGQALGRRIRAITRTLLHLECPDPDQSDRLRLWVEKSYAKKPPALGVTIGTNGNTYDFTPPVKIDPPKGGRPPVKLDKAIAFLEAELGSGDQKGCELISKWTGLGESKPTIFNAKDSMVADGRLVVDDSKKPQIWHLVQAAP
jgi:hypothetical protein